MVDCFLLVLCTVNCEATQDCTGKHSYEQIDDVHYVMYSATANHRKRTKGTSRRMFLTRIAHADWVVLATLSTQDLGPTLLCCQPHFFRFPTPQDWNE
jgi:hypothetical protein